MFIIIIVIVVIIVVAGWFGDEQQMRAGRSRERGDEAGRERNDGFGSISVQCSWYKTASGTGRQNDRSCRRSQETEETNSCVDRDAL